MSRLQVSRRLQVHLHREYESSDISAAIIGGTGGRGDIIIVITMGKPMKKALSVKLRAFQY